MQVELNFFLGGEKPVFQLVYIILGFIQPTPHCNSGYFFYFWVNISD